MVITFLNGWNIFSPCFLYIIIKLLILLFFEITWKLPINTSACSLSFTVMIRDLEKLLNTSFPCLPNAFNGLNVFDDTLLSVVVIHSSLIYSVLSRPLVSTHPGSAVVSGTSSMDKKTLLHQSLCYRWMCNVTVLNFSGSTHGAINANVLNSTQYIYIFDNIVQRELHVFIFRM